MEAVAAATSVYQILATTFMLDMVLTLRRPRRWTSPASASPSALRPMLPLQTSQSPLLIVLQTQVLEAT